MGINIYYGCNGSPSETELSNIWEINKPSLLKFLTLTTKGVHGKYINFILLIIQAYIN